MSRLKLPAYGKALWDYRRRGFHPLWVDVIYGDDWSAAVERAKLEQAVVRKFGMTVQPYGGVWQQSVGNPLLAIKPRDYAPGVYDFRCVAGLMVSLLDGCGASSEVTLNERGEAVGFGVFYDLVGELAAWAAEVNLPEQNTYASLLAESWRIYNPATRQRDWPRWWSDELKAKSNERFKGWSRAAEQRIGAAAGA